MSETAEERNTRVEKAFEARRREQAERERIDLNRDYGHYVEDPYVWISPFAAYARVQYELGKLEKDRDRLEEQERRLAPHQHAARGMLEEKLLDLDICEHAIQSIDHKF